MEFQYRTIFYPGNRRHTSRELESKFKDAFPAATIDWERGQSHVDLNLAHAKKQNLPQVMQDAIAQQNGGVFHLEIPVASSRSTLFGYVQYIDGWLGDSIAMEMTSFNLAQMIETSFEISDAIDFEFVLRHEEQFYLDAYSEKCDDPNEFVDSRFQLSLNEIELNMQAITPLEALSHACQKLAPESSFKLAFEINARSILDSLKSISSIEQSWGFDTGSDGLYGALFVHSDWTSVFTPKHA